MAGGPAARSQMDEPHERDESPRDPGENSVDGLIDDLCDEFETRWKTGQRPRIEDFLGHVAEEHRHILLSHLLDIELHWRRRGDEVPAAEEYTQRFPRDRQTIEELLAQDAQAPSTPNAQSDTVLLDAETRGAAVRKSSRTLGSYQLIEELGRGGMGIVYRAWQASANRHVALKLIRRDRLESLPKDRQASVIHRFEHEAQAAGRIEHDHIVTVYEVGEIDGEHFFSMRYVEGQSLNGLLQAGPLDGRRAAAYLEPVARAVHEAHLHGILHRDIKPQNILIDAKTDRALVLDFGLAKLAEGAEGMTEAGDVMGTPPYMSPEQAKDSSRVTAKSDVYGLGATLYHAVTGRPPFQAASVFETILMVADQAPLPPRQIDPRIDRDLETICLKCLEKDPARRYASAEALADELRRYLNHEPIEARPLGVAGRTVRWCRRYPVVASLLCCTAVLFLVALTASIVGYVKTSAALAESERSDQRTRQTVNDFFTRVSEESLLNQPGMQPLRQDLLEMALGYYEQFVKERGDDPAVRDELAMNAYRLGRISEQLGSLEEAESWYRRALGIQRQLVSERPEDIAIRQALGDTLNAMGTLSLNQGRFDEARQSYLLSAEQRKELVRLDPNIPEWQRKQANSYMNLGVVARESGNKEEARKQFIQAQAIRYRILETDSGNADVRRDLAMGCYNLANLYNSLIPKSEAEGVANLEEARCLFQESNSLFENLLSDDPNDLTNQYRTALTARLLGDVLAIQDRVDDARTPYQRALELMRFLAYRNPDVPNYSLEFAELLMNYGTLGTDSETLSNFIEARWFFQKLLTDNPDDRRAKDGLAATLYSIGNLKNRLGEREEALSVLQDALVLYEELVGGETNDRKNQYRMAETARLYGDLLSHFGRRVDARQAYQRAMNLMRTVRESDPDNAGYQSELAAILMNLGLTLDDDREVAGLFDEAHQILDKLFADHPDVAQYKRDLAAVLCAIGNLSARTGNQEKALELMRQGRQHLEQLCSDYPDNVVYSQLLRDAKQHEDAIAVMAAGEHPPEDGGPSSDESP